MRQPRRRARAERRAVECAYRPPFVMVTG
jgi:hypothetical protein